MSKTRLESQVENYPRKRVNSSFPKLVRLCGCSKTSGSDPNETPFSPFSHHSLWSSRKKLPSRSIGAPIVKVRQFGVDAALARQLPEKTRHCLS